MQCIQCATHVRESFSMIGSTDTLFYGRLSPGLGNYAEVRCARQLLPRMGFVGPSCLNWVWRPVFSSANLRARRLAHNIPRRKDLSDYEPLSLQQHWTLSVVATYRNIWFDCLFPLWVKRKHMRSFAWIKLLDSLTSVNCIFFPFCSPTRVYISEYVHKKKEMPNFVRKRDKLRAQGADTIPMRKYVRFYEHPISNSEN